MERKRIILDSSVYGAFLEKGRTDLVERLCLSPNVIIYGFSIIRRELRRAPVRKYFEGVNLRSFLLYTYDRLTQKHEYPLNDVIERIAHEYSDKYTGGISRDLLWNDFLIVACASFHRLDIIITDDNHSMASDPAKRAYEEVNKKYGLEKPSFLDTEGLESLV